MGTFRPSHLVVVVLVLVASAPPATAQVTEYVSVDSFGVQFVGDNGLHTRVAISGDGNRVAFCTGPFPGGGASGDVWVRDRAAGTTTQMNLATDAGPADCIRPDISGDGAHVAWIYAGDGFAHMCDVAAPLGTTAPVSVPDGPYIAGVTPPADAEFVALSDDGRFVAFSTFSALLPGGGGNGLVDVYLRDRLLETTVLCSTTPAGFEGAGNSGHLVGPSISSDGRYVVFESESADLAPLPGPMIGAIQTYRFDRDTGTVDLVSVTADGLCAGNDWSGEYGHDVSADGSRIAFHSFATNLTSSAAAGCVGADPMDQVWLKDMDDGSVELLSVDELGMAVDGRNPRINKAPPGGGIDGQFVVFIAGGHLAPEDTNLLGFGGMDVYRRDLVNGITDYVSISFDGMASDGNCNLAIPPNEELFFAYPDISGNGSAAVFYSKATNLVAGGDDGDFGAHDVFVRQLAPPCEIECLPEHVIEPAETNCGMLGGDPTNGGCNMNPPAFVPIACGDTICGVAWALDGARDTDWYTFTLAAPAEVVWSVAGEGPMRAILFTPGVNGCADRLTRATTTAIGCAPAELRAILPAGDHWAWAGTSNFAGVSCDTPYLGTLTCTPAGCCSVGGTEIIETELVCLSLTGVYAGDGMLCPPPVNDDCPDALPISPGQTIGGSTEAAAPDDTAPTPCNGVNVTAPGVWFRLTGNGNELVASLCSLSDYDAELFVYGGPCDALNCIAADDDFCAVGGSSQVTFCALPERTYHIFVTGWSVATGEFELTLTDSGVACACLPTETTRISLSFTGGQAFATNTADQVTPDGRFVVLRASGSTLVPGDTNARPDIIVRDLQNATNERVSVSSSELQSDGDSEDGSISNDGRIVAFTSTATNLAPGDTNGTWDVFYRDRQTGLTTRILGPGGVQPNNQAVTTAVSADGRYIAFNSTASNLVGGDTNATTDVFVRDRQTGTMARVSVTSGGAQGNGLSYSPQISADGRFVVYASVASNLVAGDSNGFYDIFVRDLQTGSVQRVSVSSGGLQSNGDSFSPTVSGDGTWIAFASGATNLVSGDTNAQRDAFLKNRLTGAIERISIGATGAQGNGESWVPTRGAIIGVGREVVFNSWATTLVGGDTNGQPDAFLRDRGNPVAGGPSIWQHPDDVTAATGGQATFSVIAEGLGPVTYQWRKDTVALVNSAHIAGATTATLTISILVAADAGSYDCVVIDGCGMVTSEAAFLTLPPAPEPGDLDCDGNVNFFDIDPFLLGLLDPAGYAAAHPDCDLLAADMNGDNEVNFFDIDGFLACLLSGVCP